MEDAQSTYGHEVYIMGEMKLGNVEIESKGWRKQETAQNTAYTMRIFRVDLQRLRVDNERLIKDQ